jgi:hypothetical protein
VEKALVAKEAEVAKAVEAEWLLLERPTQSFSERAELVVVADPVSKQDPDFRLGIRGRAGGGVRQSGAGRHA